MEMVLALLILLPLLLVAIVYVGSAVFLVWTTIKGVSRLRFSLRSLMLTVVGGATCVTLLVNQKYPLLGLLGLVCTSIYVMILVSHLLALGSAPAPANAVRPVIEKPNPNAV